MIIIIVVTWVMTFSETFFFKKHGIITIPMIEKSNSNLVIKAKDKIKKGENTNVIYKIEFKQCDASYVGQTNREVYVHVREHGAGIDRVIKKEKALAKKQEKEKQRGRNHKVLRSHKNKKAEQPKINIDDNKDQKKDNTPPITQHYIHTKHNFKWENFLILDKEP